RPFRNCKVNRRPWHDELGSTSGRVYSERPSMGSLLADCVFAVSLRQARGAIRALEPARCFPALTVQGVRSFAPLQRYRGTAGLPRARIGFNTDGIAAQQGARVMSANRRRFSVLREPSRERLLLAGLLLPGLALAAIIVGTSQPDVLPGTAGAYTIDGKA